MAERSGKKVLIAVPPAMLAQVDFIAAQEHRTRSDLIREALRRYMGKFDQKDLMGAVLSLQHATEKEA